MRTQAKRIGGALLLGPLSLIASLAAALLLVLLVFLVDAMVGKGRVIGILGGEIGAARVSLFVTMATSVLAGCAVVAYVSWRHFRSMGLATLTLLAGLVSHVVFMMGAAVPFGDTDPVARGLDAKRDAADAYADSVYARYASIDTLRYEMAEPMGGIVPNKHPEFGPLYRKIVILAPVSIRHPGPYRVEATYEGRLDRPSWRKGSTVYDTLAVGDKELSVPVDFGHEGVWSPHATGGIARVTVYGVVDRRELRNLRLSRMSLTKEEQDELRGREERRPSLVAGGPIPVKVSVFVRDFRQGDLH